jgi:cytochrome b561
MADFVYSRPSIALHWLVAALVTAGLGLGIVMTRVGLDLEPTVRLYGLHKSIGLAVFALMPVRMVARRRHPPPSRDNSLRSTLARVVHAMFYMLLLTLPVVGWLQVSAAPIPFPTILFGVIDVPHLAILAELPYDQRLAWYNGLAACHRGLGLALACLVPLHVAGATWPEPDGNRPLRRMLARG